jgi:AmmeMemoRadiSam system protein A
MPSTTIAHAERIELLRLARASISSGLTSGALAPFEQTRSGVFDGPRATFVTLRTGHDLRGCCGSIEPRYVLAEDVWRNAWASAFADPRFAPLTAAEFDALSVHISVLTPLQPWSVANEEELIASLRPGCDGLLLAYGASRATFLPSVWDSLREPRELIRQLKLKAGWPADFWSPQLQVWRYETESFGEAH